MLYLATQSHSSKTTTGHGEHQSGSRVVLRGIRYLGVHNHLLRYFTSEGELVPTPNEDAERALIKAEQAIARAMGEAQRADRETLRADREARRAEQERKRAEQFAAKLRELGVDPETI